MEKHPHIPFVEGYNFINNEKGFLVREECRRNDCGWSRQFFSLERPQ